MLSFNCADRDFEAGLLADKLSAVDYVTQLSNQRRAGTPVQGLAVRNIVGRKAGDGLCDDRNVISHCCSAGSRAAPDLAGAAAN